MEVCIIAQIQTYMNRHSQTASILLYCKYSGECGVDRQAADRQGELTIDRWVNVAKAQGVEFLFNECQYPNEDLSERCLHGT